MNTEITDPNSVPQAVAPVSRLSAEKTKSFLLLCTAVIALLLAAMFLSLVLGARNINFADAVQAVSGSRENISQIIASKRIARTVLAALGGSALAISGVLLQAVTRNPLADSGILGISSGAALAVVIGIVYFHITSPFTYIWLAILGCVVAAGLVWGFASLGGGTPTPLKLALAGAITWASCSSLIGAILLPQVDLIQRFQFWQVGGVGGASWEKMLLITPFLVIGTVVSFLISRSLNVLALGDEVASGLGVHTNRLRLTAAASALLLTGSITAVAGPIGFVGLVVPHMCRLQTDNDHRLLVPLSALTGALLLVSADVLGRIATRPHEIEIGIVTAFIGAPLFIFQIRRQSVGDL